MRAVRRGFTLIELIVVLVVIGIIAAIAIAKFVGVKEAAYIASMKSDLRNFALYEQFYATDNGGNYFAGNGAGEGFKPTPDVTVTAITDPGPPPSWHATAVHAKTPKTCTIGVATPSAWTVVCP
ncbi:MAG: prepilin-type N-terminal cleavage/methylation domain-containing protein [Gemmatimonadota bacterium]|nr:prepilin-type N-terminal cleavage/methylation domain-containing protein [Gemmatimonadota bacterium]